jgi:hypothetical protein
VGVTCNFKVKLKSVTRRPIKEQRPTNIWRGSPVPHFHQAAWTPQSLALLPLPLQGSGASTHSLPLRPPITALAPTSPPPGMALWKI